MKPVLLKAAIATLLSIIASLAISWVAIRLTGGSMNWFGAFMSTLCPLLIAFPASAFTFYQNHRIALAHQELEAAHRELAGLYRRLAASARIDDMTGLLNRNTFIEELNQAGRQGAGGVSAVSACAPALRWTSRRRRRSMQKRTAVMVDRHNILSPCS